MANKKIFCNSPWYELHIYWDGSLGICCQEDHKLYNTDQRYNIATTTIEDWFNSQPVRDFRQALLGDTPTSICARCTRDEDMGANSRRIKSNQKSVIFTHSAFDESFKQSPGYHHFESSIIDGRSDTLPVDLHVDLGNHCNLACKMCGPQASSTIASRQVQWGIESSRQYLNSDWTKNSATWNSFLQQLLELPTLNNIHFMGGETILTHKFEQFVDFFVEHRRFDLCISFVTNGTVFKPDLINKLKLFRRVGIEVSIETVDKHNAYQRQGTNTEQVLANIAQYQQWCKRSNITVALRPAPSALTTGYHVGLLQYAIEHGMIVKSNQVYSPAFLNVGVLPKAVKQLYVDRYTKFLDTLPANSVSMDYNASDANNCVAVIREHAEACVNALIAPDPKNQLQLQADLVAHCQRWDQVYKLDARELYPEWKELLSQHDYTLSS